MKIIKFDDTLTKIYETLTDDEKRKQLEFDYYLYSNGIQLDSEDSINPDDYPDFHSYLDNLKILLIGYFENKVCLLIDKASKSYLFRCLKYKFPEIDFYINYKIWSVSDFLMWFVWSVKVAQINDKDLQQRYDLIYMWIDKNKVEFLTFIDPKTNEVTHIPLLK